MTSIEGHNFEGVTPQDNEEEIVIPEKHKDDTEEELEVITPEQAGFKTAETSSDKKPEELSIDESQLPPNWDEMTDEQKGAWLVKNHPF